MGIEPRSLIQPSETLLVELTRTHNYIMCWSEYCRKVVSKCENDKQFNIVWPFLLPKIDLYFSTLSLFWPTLKRRWKIIRLGVIQGSSKGFDFPNGLEIGWTFLFHMPKTLTSEALWFGGNSVLTTIPSILLPFIMALELWRTRLLSVLVKSFCIGVLHELFELPYDVGFHFRIIIVWSLICVTVFGLQCHALTLTQFLNPDQTQFIGLQVANQLCQRNFINVVWFLTGGDPGMESLR